MLETPKQFRLRNVFYRLILVASAFVIGCSNNVRASRVYEKPSIEQSINKKENTVWERYGENIVYQNFHDIDFNCLPKEQIRKPSDLEQKIYREIIPSDEKKLESQILNIAEKIGYPYKSFKNFSAKESIQLCMDISACALSYKEVDTDKDFLKKYGEFLPLWKYVELGVGDCDKYRDIVRKSFSIIKNVNPNLNNVYDFDQEIMGTLFNHAWNTFVFLDKDKMIVTQIDPTHYSQFGRFEAIPGHHFSKENLRRTASFYFGISDYDNAYNLYKKIFERDVNSSNTDKSILIEKLGFIAGSLLRDDKKMEFVREEYLKLGGDAKNWDEMLYYSYRLERFNNRMNQAKDYRDRLFNEFPNSCWSKYIKEELTQN